MPQYIPYEDMDEAVREITKQMDKLYVQVLNLHETRKKLLIKDGHQKLAELCDVLIKGYTMYGTVTPFLMLTPEEHRLLNMAPISLAPLQATKWILDHDTIEDSQRNTHSRESVIEALSNAREDLKEYGDELEPMLGSAKLENLFERNEIILEGIKPFDNVVSKWRCSTTVSQK